MNARIKQREVACPHCRATQPEPLGAISTNCRACGRYFKLNQPKEERASRAPKPSREVFCIKCGAPNLVVSAAISTQCIRCSHYLELGDKVVKGVQTGKLYAYDDVVFAEGCSFKGMEATGRRIEIRGKVFSKLRATAEIIAFENSQVSGELHAPVIRIERGAKAKVQTVQGARLDVAGDFEISGNVDVSEVILSHGATFSGRLANPEVKLTLQAGAALALDTIVCSVIDVEGTATIESTVTANEVIVRRGGSLKAARFITAAITVEAGGVLQGRIEKSVPNEAPAEHPPAEHPPEAQAA